MLKLIPAIDLRNGQVVRATTGKRESYRPLATAMFPSATPRKVLEYLYRHLRFRTFYFADLDAIMQTGSNNGIILEFLEMHTDAVAWTDAGIRQQHDYTQLKMLHPAIVPIIPTETLADTALLKTIGDDEGILSLDFKKQRLMGMQEIWEQSNDWPNIVIILSLDAVGSKQPDLVTLRRVLERHRQTCRKRQIILGGGVHDAEDLQKISAAGAAGVLLATALYNGTLP